MALEEVRDGGGPPDHLLHHLAHDGHHREAAVLQLRGELGVALGGVGVALPARGRRVARRLRLVLLEDLRLGTPMKKMIWTQPAIGTTFSASSPAGTSENLRPVDGERYPGNWKSSAAM